MNEFIPAERQKVWMSPIDEVYQHPQNPNNGDTEAILESLEEFGLYAPIVAQLSTHRILKGNHVWAAAKEKGETHILTLFVDVDDDEAVRIMVGDNEIARRARPDLGQLKDLLNDLRERQALRGTGHTVESVLDLAQKVRAAANAALDADERPVCSQCGQRIRTVHG